MADELPISGSRPAPAIAETPVTTIETGRAFLALWVWSVFELKIARAVLHVFAHVWEPDLISFLRAKYRAEFSPILLNLAISHSGQI